MLIKNIFLKEIKGIKVMAPFCHRRLILSSSYRKLHGKTLELMQYYNNHCSNKTGCMVCFIIFNQGHVLVFVLERMRVHEN